MYSKEFLLTTTWNRRYTELSNMLHKDDQSRKFIIDVLTELKRKKDLSFGEKKLLDRASNYSEHYHNVIRGRFK